MLRLIILFIVSYFLCKFFQITEAPIWIGYICGFVAAIIFNFDIKLVKKE